MSQPEHLGHLLLSQCYLHCETHLVLNPSVTPNGSDNPCIKDGENAKIELISYSFIVTSYGSFTVLFVFSY